jgi:hypothetical protein
MSLQTPSDQLPGWSSRAKQGIDQDTGVYDDNIIHVKYGGIYAITWQHRKSN